jgi:hypothetical protein
MEKRRKGEKEKMESDKGRKEERDKKKFRNEKGRRVENGERRKEGQKKKSQGYTGFYVAAKEVQKTYNAKFN